MKSTQFLFLLIGSLFFLLSFSLKTQAYETVADCDAPIIEPKGQLFLCKGTSILLKTNQAASIYKWYKNGILIDGATTAALEVTEAASYKVTTTSEDGSCSASSLDREVVAIGDGDNSLKLAITAENGLRFCEGGSLELKVEGNFKNILWATKPNPQNTSTITVTEPGTYNVGVQIEGGCSISGEITVTTMAAPLLQIEASDTVFRAGQPVNLMATGGNDLRWFPSEGLNDTGIANPTASPRQTTTYYVTGFSANGCSDTAAITLYYDGNILDIRPSKTFSPNNDGIDDVWNINNIESYPNCSLVIFNRQGLEVFKAKPYLNDWDGHYRGNPLPEGDYYFVIRSGNENLRTGSILLVR